MIRSQANSANWDTPSAATVRVKCVALEWDLYICEVQRSVRYVFFGLIWMRAQLARNLAHVSAWSSWERLSLSLSTKSLMRKCSLTSSLILFKRGQKINLRLGVAASVYYIFLLATAALSSKAPGPFLLDGYLPKIRAHLLRGVQYFPVCRKKSACGKLEFKERSTPTCSYMLSFPCRVSIWCLCAAILGALLYGGLNFYYVSVI